MNITKEGLALLDTIQTNLLDIIEDESASAASRNAAMGHCLNLVKLRYTTDVEISTAGDVQSNFEKVRSKFAVVT